jgi:hypothetical protein
MRTNADNVPILDRYDRNIAASYDPNIKESMSRKA